MISKFISNKYFNTSSKELTLILVLMSLMIFFIYNVPENFYPDHEILKNRFIKNENNSEIIYTPQAFFISILNLIIDKLCNVDISNNFFLSKIINESGICKEKLEIQDLSRFYYVAITFFFITFLYFYNKCFFKNSTDNNYLYLLCLMMPSTLLNITALSPEAIYSSISIFVIANINLKNIISRENFLMIPLVFYSYFLDKGNLYIFLSFMIITIFAYKFILKGNDKIYFFYFFLLILFFTFSKEVFLIVGEFIDKEKTADLINDVKALNLNDIEIKNLISRIFYFWITLLNLYFPHLHLLSIFSLLFWFCISILLIINIKKKNFFKKCSFHSLLITAIPFSVIVVYILPTHAYGKYYLFIIVIIIKLLIDLLNLKKVILIIPTVSIISISEIIFFNGFNLKNFLY